MHVQEITAREGVSASEFNECPVYELVINTPKLNKFSFDLNTSDAPSGITSREGDK